MSNALPLDVIDAYRHLGKALHIEPICGGLINKTFKINTNKISYILQEVSPIFKPTVHLDIEAITKHLLSLGLITPVLIPTYSDELYIESYKRVFRAQTYINGRSSHTISSSLQASEAGRMLALFHKAMKDFKHNYNFSRTHGGNYKVHYQNLLDALAKNEQHDHYKEAIKLATPMLNKMQSIINSLSTTLRHAHGDPKISNILFNEQGLGICLVDLDTFSYTGWSLEIADALRSWCNPLKEDVLGAKVDLDIAKSALFGYGSLMRGLISKAELDEIIAHSQAISLCLAMRYLSDVLNESYFAFDKSRFLRAAEHNLLRAQAMWQLYLDFCYKEDELIKLVQLSLG